LLHSLYHYLFFSTIFFDWKILKIQLLGSDEVTIGNVDAGSHHIGYFYDYGNSFKAAGGQIVPWDTDSLCYARFSLSIGDTRNQSIAWVNIVTHNTRSGNYCYYTYPLK
jgi:hypothetical protein